MKNKITNFLKDVKAKYAYLEGEEIINIYVSGDIINITTIQDDYTYNYSDITKEEFEVFVSNFEYYTRKSFNPEDY